MLGFAIVDRQTTATTTAVWLTTHVGGTTVQHTNAVVLDNDDPRYSEILYALTAARIVVLTAGSAADELFERPVTVDFFEELVAETAARQLRIEKAIIDYMSRIKNKSLVIPDFPSPPKLHTETHSEPQFRALELANYVAAVWSGWLRTEEQRVRRISEPALRHDEHRVVNKKKVQRLWAEEGLQRRVHSRRKRTGASSHPQGGM